MTPIRVPASMTVSAGRLARYSRVSWPGVPPPNSSAMPGPRLKAQRS